MEPAFKDYVARSNSVVAAHAISRALADRASLADASKLLDYLDLVCGGEKVARDIARDGLIIIIQAHGGSLEQLETVTVSAYVKWLSEFVIERAARGRAPNPDRGHTLLVELRKTVT